MLKARDAAPDATDVRLREIPFTPERVLGGLKAKRAISQQW